MVPASNTKSPQLFFGVGNSDAVSIRTFTVDKARPSHDVCTSVHIYPVRPYYRSREMILDQSPWKRRLELERWKLHDWQNTKQCFGIGFWDCFYKSLRYKRANSKMPKGGVVARTCYSAEQEVWFKSWRTIHSLNIATPTRSTFTIFTCISNDACF